MAAVARAVAIIGMTMQHAFAENDCASAFGEMDEVCYGFTLQQLNNGEDPCSSTCQRLKYAAASACASVTELTVTASHGTDVVNPMEKINDMDTVCRDSMGDRACTDKTPPGFEQNLGDFYHGGPDGRAFWKRFPCATCQEAFSAAEDVCQMEKQDLTTVCSVASCIQAMEHTMKVCEDPCSHDRCDPEEHALYEKEYVRIKDTVKQTLEACEDPCRKKLMPALAQCQSNTELVCDVTCTGMLKGLLNDESCRDSMIGDGQTYEAWVQSMLGACEGNPKPSPSPSPTPSGGGKCKQIPKKKAMELNARMCD